MTLLTGGAAAALRSIGTRFATSAPRVVSGEAFLTAADVTKLTGQTATNLLGRTAVAQARQATGGGKAMFAVADVAASARKQGLRSAATTIKGLGGHESYTPIDAARSARAGGAGEDITALLNSGELTSVHVRLEDGSFLQAIPTAHIPGGVADAATGAATAAGSGIVERNRSQLMRGALIGTAILGTGIGIKQLFGAGDGGTDGVGRRGHEAATSAGGTAPSQTAGKKPAANATKDHTKTSEPSVPTTTTHPSASASVSHASVRGAAIAKVAAGEVAAHVGTPATGKLTAPVAKYFSVSHEARAKSSYQWQGYFAAWVRAKAGEPVTPKNRAWLTIDDMIATSKQQKSWAPAGKMPTVGSVVFINHNHSDRIADDAGIVTAVIEDPAHPGDAAHAKLQIVRGDVDDAAHHRRSVSTATIAANNPAIKGYALAR